MGTMPLKCARYMLLATVLALAGCEEVKITSNPEGAEIYLTVIHEGKRQELGLQGVTPGKVTVDFNKPVTYEVQVRKPQYRTATVVLTKAESSGKPLKIELKQYLKTVPATTFQLHRVGEQAPRLLPVRTETQGYVDVTEPSPLVQGCQELASEASQYDDLMWVSASKTDQARVVFQAVTSFSEAKDYTPTEDETLRSIADRFDLELPRLRELNGLPRGVTVARKGQRLIVSEAMAVTQVLRRQTDGTRVTVVTDGRNTDLFPSFTWQGDEVILTSNKTRQGQPVYSLHRVKYESPSLTMAEIAPTDVQNYGPSISLDGTVYFSSLARGTVFPAIWSLQLNGSQLTQLNDNGEFPQVSRDESELVFLRRVAENNPNRQVWRMAGNGSNLTQLTSNVAYDISGASWSPDGNWIVFASNQIKNADGIANYALWMMDKDGKRVQRLTTNGSWDDCPSWNSTGTEIFFRSNRGGRWRIWRIKPVRPAL